MNEIVVLDDDRTFVDAVVTRLSLEDIPATGFTTVAEFAAAARAGKLHDVRLMFLDMNLGRQPDGSVATAADVIPIAKTYAPAANILIFTHKGIAIEDCIQCVRLGALGLIPKSESGDQLLLAAQVYPHVGDPARTREAIISELWTRLQPTRARNDGQLFEMLVANLLASVEGLSLIGNNWKKPSGEIDLIFRNNAADQFWAEPDSFLIIVECKNRKDATDIKEFNHFKKKVEATARCRIGIMVSWVKASSDCRALQHFDRDGAMIFLLDREDLQELIAKPAAEREPHLRAILVKQLY